MTTRPSIMGTRATRLVRALVGVALVFGFITHGPISADAGGRAKAVYAMTNDVTGNEIVIYDRAPNGLLTLVETVATAGLGGIGEPPEPVDALGSQAPLILSDNGRWLFAVNAGSDDISVFRVEADGGLTLTDLEPSGGPFPVSLTHHGSLLYVLNSGGDGNISGFTFDPVAGDLAPLPGSTRGLGAGGTNPPFFLVSPAQVGFNPKGDMLVVTEKGSNEIHVFTVDPGGIPAAQPVTSISNGFTPFGFGFDKRGRLIVAEAFGTGSQPPPPTLGAGAISSYEIRSDGSLKLLSGSVGNFQTATCWLETGQGRFAYATNNASNTITGYRIAKDGSVSLLDADGVTANTGLAPVDLAVSGNGRFLYTVNAFSGTVSMFKINKSDGSLTALGEIGGLPFDDGAVGIAAN